MDNSDKQRKKWEDGTETLWCVSCGQRLGTLSFENYMEASLEVDEDGVFEFAVHGDGWTIATPKCPDCFDPDE